VAEYVGASTGDGCQRNHMSYNLAVLRDGCDDEQLSRQSRSHDDAGRRSHMDFCDSDNNRGWINPQRIGFRELLQRDDVLDCR
jgi:hypothetical protein